MGELERALAHEQDEEAKAEIQKGIALLKKRVRLIKGCPDICLMMRNELTNIWWCSP